MTVCSKIWVSWQGYNFHNSSILPLRRTGYKQVTSSHTEFIQLLQRVLQGHRVRWLLGEVHMGRDREARYPSSESIISTHHRPGRHIHDPLGYLPSQGGGRLDLKFCQRLSRKGGDYGEAAPERQPPRRCSDAHTAASRRKA